MKKRMFAAVALAATMGLALASCGGGNRDAEPPVSDSPAQVEEGADSTEAAGEETAGQPCSLPVCPADDEKGE